MLTNIIWLISLFCFQGQEHWKEYYERLQEKLTRLREAREALDVLREEHREKLRLEAEERHHEKQLQMVAKLDALRLRKREYLEHQRQIAYQQMQAQEQELVRRKQMSTYQPFAYVPGSLQAGQRVSGPPGLPGQSPFMPIQQMGAPQQVSVATLGRQTADGIHSPIIQSHCTNDPAEFCMQVDGRGACCLQAL